ncbi:MAG: glycosyltransferase family 4 protein [Acidimicrobiales bacterium]
MRVAVTLEQCWHRVPGGTARAAIESVRALDATGGVELIGVSARHRRPPPEPWVPPIPVEQLRIPRLVMYEGWHHLGWPHVEEATGPVDLVHATGVAVPPRTVPLVVTVHDLAVLHDRSHFTRRGVSFMRAAIDHTRERGDLVLCSSRATLEDCVDNGFDPERLRLVPLGVDVGPVDDRAVARVRAEYRLPERFVLFVGTMEPRKNLVTLLDAVAMMDDDGPPLVLVGPTGWGDDGGSRIEALGDRVRALGFVPADDLAAIYAAAEVFAYPSLLEGFGLPVLEAMAQGTPVVTSVGTATEELVRDGGGVAVEPRDPDAIATAIGSVLEDPTAAMAMGEQGRAVASAHTWERTAGLTLDAYRELV